MNKTIITLAAVTAAIVAIRKINRRVPAPHVPYYHYS
jgi:hypothetical protein